MTGIVDDRAARIAALGYDYAALEKEGHGPCNLCGSEIHVEASRIDRYGFAAPMRLCARCGLGFLSPRLTPGGYAHFYESVYRPLVSAYHGYVIDAVSVQEDQREYAAGIADFLGHTLQQPPRTIMDVGGSTGLVAGVVGGPFGAACTVLDPAPDELAVAEAAGMETIAGFAEDYDPRGRTWDLVLLCQTIDHLLDVDATLRAMRAMTARGGHLFIDVVDLKFMMRRRGQVEGAVKIDHPFYLTRDTALAWWQLVGFDVIAERLSDEGEWGFLLRVGEPQEPNWELLREHADDLLDDIWRRRATRA
jgi:SAM-dependent methyltransferase